MACLVAWRVSMGSVAEELGCAVMCSEDSREDMATKVLQWAMQCWGLQQPALTSSSLRDPVLSCPEALHCAQLGAAQYRMHRGGSRQEARTHCVPSAALTRLFAI